MKNIINLLTICIITLLTAACNKEELHVLNDKAANNEKSTNLNVSFAIKKKLLNAKLMAKEVDYGPRTGHTSQVFKDKMWVIGGYGKKNMNDVWNSSNGSNWKIVNANPPFIPRANHASAVFKNKIWVVGGDELEVTGVFDQLNDIWYSPNGKNWKQAIVKAAFSPRVHHSLTAFNGSLWLIGGWTYNFDVGSQYHADVWRSSDGHSWEMITDDAPFSTRTQHVSLVHDGKLWVIGGWAEDPFGYLDLKNDVWYSDDGTTWTEATSSAAFPPVADHAVVSDGEWMWLTAGKTLGAASNQIWRSKNGINWFEVDTSEPYPERMNHTSLIYDDKLWILNGYSGTLSLPDVWAMD